MATTIISASNTTAALGAVLGIGNDTASLGTTGLTGVVVNIDLGIAANFEVDGSHGSTVTINQDLAAVTSLKLNTNGADFILQNPGLSVGAAPAAPPWISIMAAPSSWDPPFSPPPY